MSLLPAASVLVRKAEAYVIVCQVSLCTTSAGELTLELAECIVHSWILVRLATIFNCWHSPVNGDAHMSHDQRSSIW